MEKKKKRNFHSQSDKEYEPEHTNHSLFSSRKEVVVESLSHVQLFVTPWTAAHWTSLSLTISGNLLKLMSIESVMPSNHFIVCRPLLLLQSFPGSGSFPMSQLFTSGGQSIGASASASVLPMNNSNLGLHYHFSLSCIGEGNGNPLQCSCLENPRDRGSLVGCHLWGPTESDMT